MNTTIIEKLAEALSFDFFLRALLVGVILAVNCAVLGNYVVLRKEVIVTHAISHSALLGIAFALLFNLNLNLSVLAACILGVVIISFLQNTKRFSQDSILELSSQLAIAGAIVAISQLEGYRTDIMQFLFGDILAIADRDILFTVILLVMSLVFLVLFRKRLLQVVFNEELAKSVGVKVEVMNLFFMIILAFTVAIGLKIVGAILLSAFLVIPANTSKTIAKNFHQMTFLSIAFAIFGTVVGLFMSYVFDVPSGPMIILAMGFVFMVTVLFTGKRS